MSDPETGLGPAPGGDNEGSGVSEETERQREEILHLRDLLIGKDAELATMKLRIAQLENAQARRIGARLRSRVRSAGARIIAALRGG